MALRLTPRAGGLHVPVGGLLGFVLCFRLAEVLVERGIGLNRRLCVCVLVAASVLLLLGSTSNLFRMLYQCPWVTCCLRPGLEMGRFGEGTGGYFLV